MPTELLEGAGLPNWPERLSGSLIILFYFALLGIVLYQYRDQFFRFRRRDWIGMIVLSLLSLTIVQWLVYPFSFFHLVFPFAAQGAGSKVILLEFVPIFLAALFLNPLAALVVGFSLGFGNAIWHSQQIFPPFYFALVTVFMHWSIQQVYAGRLYKILRQPIVVGMIALLPLLVGHALSAYSYVNIIEAPLNAVDWAAASSWNQLFLWLLEVILGGVVVTATVIGLDLRPSQRGILAPDLSRKGVAEPVEQTLNGRLMSSFILFGLMLSVGVGVLVFLVSLSLSRTMVLDQMAHDASSVAAHIPDFRTARLNFLTQAANNNDRLIDSDETVRNGEVEMLFYISTFYSEILWVNTDGVVEYAFPTSTAKNLSTEEAISVADSLSTGFALMGPAEEINAPDYRISVIAPLVGENDQVHGVLVGRVPRVDLFKLVKGMQGTVGEGSGFIVDEKQQIIAHPNPNSILTKWQPPTVDAILSTKGAGTAFEGRHEGTNARELVYYLDGPNHPWLVVVTVPYSVVLGQATSLTVSLMALLIVSWLFFSLQLFGIGQDVARPLNRLIGATQRITSGDLDTPIDTTGDSEVARLGRSFEKMQRSLKTQLDDLTLLLRISQQIAASMDINRGMPVILQGALRATGAATVRVAVQNPAANQPLTFSEGAKGHSLSRFDQPLMHLTYAEREIVLTNEVDIRQKLNVAAGRNIDIGALVALSLQSGNRQQGVLWLAYRNKHEFNQRELNMIRTLAGQATVLVENARLYNNAESGRRRLSAVLGSTDDAVIVTDPTNRVMLINNAMSRIFNVDGSDIVDTLKPLAIAINHEKLVAAMTTTKEKDTVEITVGDRTYSGNISTIMNSSRQILGRVAVLHDVSRFKEIDQLKSEFVSTVSHDLRSPLTYMQGSVKMLPMFGSLSEKQIEQVNRINTGIEQMTSLVDDLLDLNKLDAGAELMRDEINVKLLLAQLVDVHGMAAAQNGIIMRYELEPDVTNMIGDTNFIRQALNNLLGNAVKYAADSKEIVVRASLSGEHILLTVADDGVGIPKQDTLRLFEKFYRVRNKRNSHVKGSGLGLAIVKSVAERHGGRVWCESDLGEGCIFYLELPIRGS